MVANFNKNIKNLSFNEKIDVVEMRVSQLETRFSDLGYDVRGVVQSEFKSRWKVPIHEEAINSLHTAICVDTIDPLKQGRVRFYSPLLHMGETPIKAVTWAYPISNQGGFDDCGCTWVPPAGSKICILFEAGNRDLAYYIGTTWDRERKDQGPGKGPWHPFTSVKEYEKIHKNHRGGYMVGEDETQVLPPWNTENYNNFDEDSELDFEKDTDAKNKVTYPNIYGWKTPQKHMIKMVDGNYKCNFRWQRMEFKSSQGNYLIFKDDHLHPGAQWAHPKCGCGGGDLSTCHKDDVPIEKVDQCPPNTDKSECANPYFKHSSECRPFAGPKNPQNNKLDKTTLPQSGVQLGSLSGHVFWMDDSVRIPKGNNKWERSLEPFNYGCPDDPTFIGKTVWKSAHGHQIYMCDEEPSKDPNGRTNENCIKLLTATGNRIEMNDDTIPKICKAGEKRGIEIESTSRHKIQMIDHLNEQCNRGRKEGVKPNNKATNAFVKIRSGYGLEIMMADDHHQMETQRQYIEIIAPQRDACAGAHYIKLQEDPGCGYIMVRAGGSYICLAEGDYYTAVGTSQTSTGQSGDFCKGGCLGPRNWTTLVSKHSIHSSCKWYYNKAEYHGFVADKEIYLLAGKDCPSQGALGGLGAPEDPKGPCVGRVAVLIGGQLKASDRVFASASPNSPMVSITQLKEFYKTPSP